MVHPEYGTLPVPHSPGVEKLGNPQDRKSISLAAQIESIKGDASY